ncbi:MAG: acyltransferase family protein [Bacteroidales bacterium]|nr:acyltransferase family protein [Bacteroidales bacterium]
MKERIASLDYMRAFACLMVILTHSNEPFYMGADGMVDIASHHNLVWISILDGFSRMATVPIFFLISSYLLLPLKVPSEKFFKRRFERVVVPFLVWLVIYMLFEYIPKGNVGRGFFDILFNFPESGGHMWFIYALLGMYLFMPVLSPWLETVSKKGEEAFLGIWLFTTLFSYFNLFKPELYGESYWNAFGMFCNFSGYIGYMVLAHYIKKYVEPKNLSVGKTAAVCIPVIIAGILSTVAIFYFRAPDCVTVPETELPFIHTSTIIALMNAATFILMLKITKDSGWFYSLVKEISKLSYGMYLVHLLILNFYCGIFSSVMPVPASILLTAFCTYITAFIFTKLVSLLPFGKYIVG